MGAPQRLAVLGQGTHLMQHRCAVRSPQHAGAHQHSRPLCRLQALLHAWRARLKISVFISTAAKCHDGGTNLIYTTC